MEDFFYYFVPIFKKKNLNIININKILYNLSFKKIKFNYFFIYLRLEYILKLKKMNKLMMKRNFFH
jgi:hypothetical protein